jgi:hypothetical protein
MIGNKMNWYKRANSDELLNKERVQDARSLSDGLRMNPTAWMKDGPIFQNMQELKRAFHINTIFSRLFNHWLSPHVSGFRGWGDDIYPNKYKSQEEGTRGGTKAYNDLYLLWKDEIKNAVASIPYIPDVRDMNTEQMVDPAEVSRKLLPGGRGGDFEGAIATAIQIEKEAHGEKRDDGRKGVVLTHEGERDYDNLLEIYNEEYVGDSYLEEEIPFETPYDSHEGPEEGPEDWENL